LGVRLCRSILKTVAKYWRNQALRDGGNADVAQGADLRVGVGEVQFEVFGVFGFVVGQYPHGDSLAGLAGGERGVPSDVAARRREVSASLP
jgi:hypothetical protein